MNKTRAKRLCTQNEVSSINKNNTEVDRIGRLPDKVLTHILSFLSTKEAVQTCVLSKRWKNTWTAVPILDIKQNDFSGFEDDEERRMSSTRSERFITGFLDNRAPTNLERVHCVCEFLCSHDSMGWLDRVVLLMPLQIHIFISGTGNSIDMPDLVFSCATLQHLLMSNYPDCSPMKTFISPVSVNLPSLKFLELNGIELHDDFAEKFFMGCPSLERLELCGCDLYFTCISSEVLNELTLISCTLYEQMQISCPHLVSLIMTINLKRAGISMKNMSSLVNVDIKLYAYPGKYVPDLDIFGSLSNAAKLELFLGTAVLKESLEKDITNCRNFNNLKKLVVGANWDMSYDFYLIACLLKRSPNLKELVLLLNERQGQRQESRRAVSGDVLFQHEYLEVVKIGQAYGYMFDQSKLSREPINAMMKTLGTYVKNIGNIIIT